MINKYKYLLVTVFSIFYVFSFAPYSIFPFGIISIMGLSFCFSLVSSKKDLILNTLLSSVVISIFGMYWLIYASEYSFGSFYLGILVLVGFSFLYSVFIFIISVPVYLSSKKRSDRGIFYFLLLVISWSTADAFKFYFLGGFPWFISAYLWSFSLEVMQIVSFIGVIGLSICTYALIFSIFFLFKKKESSLLRMILFFTFMIMFIAFYFYGQNRIATLDGYKPKEEISITIFQTNINQKNKMSFYDTRAISNKLLDEALKVDGSYVSSGIVFIPEASFIFYNQKDVQDLLIKIPPSVSIVTGVIRFDELNRVYNSVVSFNEFGYDNIYDKMRLVPFGERTPFSEFFPNLLNFVGLSDFSVGKEMKVFSINGYNFIVNICFEGLFPLEKIDISSVDFMVNFANEAWFNESIELKQNWNIYKFRSIELGIPVVKVSNTGVTGVIDLSGKTLVEIESFKKINKNVTIPIKKIETIFSKVNYIIVNYLLFILYIMTILFLLNKKAHKY